MEQRIEFALKALRTDNFRALCAAYGNSAKTGYKWRERLLRRGLEAMAEASWRAQQHPEQLSPKVNCEMVRLKQQHPHWGDRVRFEFCISECTGRRLRRAASKGYCPGRA